MERVNTEQSSNAARLVSTIVSVTGLATFAYALYALVSNPINTEWALVAAVTVLLISRIDIGIPKTSNTVTLSDTFIFISVLRYGTYASVVLAAVDAFICTLQFKGRRKIIWFNTAVMSLSIFVSSEAVRWAFGDPSALAADMQRLFMAAGVLALIHYAVNSGLMCLVTALRSGRTVLATWRDTFLWTSISYFVGAVAACLVINLISIISFYAFIISVPILAITYFTYKVYLDKMEASSRHAEQMADLHLRTIEALAIAIDAKDEVTHEHVSRVRIYATGLARLFGLSEPEIEALKAGALLHDIGKLAVPDYILNKPGQLTPAEFEKMKVHTIVGAEILERVGFPYPVVPVVRHHHERWDGRGYPDGLKGDEIPITARILTVADCFDAVREDRQYRKAMTREEAIAMLKEGSGTVFDPSVVSVFLDNLHEFEAQIREQRVETHRIESIRQNGAAQSRKPDSGPVVFEQIRSAHREVMVLYGIAQTIGTSLDLRDTFAVFSSRLEDIVSYTTCVLYLVKQDSTDLEAAHVAGRNSDKFKGRRIPSGLGITGWVTINRHSMHNCDPQLDFDVMRIEVPEQYRTAIVVPLTRDEEALGALALYSADLDSYTADHLRLVEAVAKLASDAIANAVHHERTETSALTDLLTGLPNARALRYRFEEELDRALRHKDTFCVMMMDLDGLKTVNDRFGHQAGDQALRDFARVLLSQVRSSDFVGRYAGDEFVGIMQVGPEEASELAHRIQRAVDRYELSFGGIKMAIGISIGWACFGSEGNTLDELLLAADRAMYADKAKRKAAPSESRNLGTSDLGQYKIM
ncbi:MAG TPA: HD domain-containing phosphohydrolase [Blastocatellia bacterium]|nr:HD domain-containing phosphohydrolase [Blastocatellia bacterium]